MKKKATEKVSKEPKQKRPAGRERITVQISQNTIERVKDVVYWERLTVAQFVEEALETALNKLEKQKGQSYPKRKAALKPGRPLS